MNTETQTRRDQSLLIGLLAGTFIGAGLAIWLAPRVSGIRERLTTSARGLSSRASERYQQVSARVDEVVDDLTKRGQSARDDMADVVILGAREVARQAAAIKTDRTADTKKHSAVDRSAAATESL